MRPQTPEATALMLPYLRFRGCSLKSKCSGDAHEGYEPSGLLCLEQHLYRDGLELLTIWCEAGSTTLFVFFVVTTATLPEVRPEKLLDDES